MLCWLVSLVVVLACCWCVVWLGLRGDGVVVCRVGRVDRLCVRLVLAVVRLLLVLLVLLVFGCVDIVRGETLGLSGHILLSCGLVWFF